MAKKIKAVFTAGAGYLIPADLATNEYMASELEAGEEYVITVTKKPASVTRSIRLNAARWLWCTLVAKMLNSYNFERRHFYDYVLRKGKGSAPWTKDSVSEFMWQPTQYAVTSMVTSTLPTPAQYQEIHMKLDNELMIMTKLTMPAWPSLEGQKAEAYNNERH